MSIYYLNLSFFFQFHYLLILDKSTVIKDGTVTKTLFPLIPVYLKSNKEIFTMLPRPTKSSLKQEVFDY